MEEWQFRKKCKIIRVCRRCGKKYESTHALGRYCKDCKYTRKVQR